MNNRTGVIILAVIAAGLAAALLLVQNHAREERKQTVDTLVTFSNRLAAATRELDEQRGVYAALTNDLNRHVAQLLVLSNQLAAVETLLNRSAASLKSAIDDIARRDGRINDLENEKQELDKHAVELTTTITNLTLEITEVRRQLAAAEGDKAFLEKELYRLVNQKAEMERRFSDLNAVRAHVRKLKTELMIAQRLDWMRRGLVSDQKGGELMMQQSTQDRDPRTNRPPRYDLRVEVRDDGTIRIVPATNRLSAAPPS